MTLDGKQFSCLPRLLHSICLILIQLVGVHLTCNKQVIDKTNRTPRLGIFSNSNIIQLTSWKRFLVFQQITKVCNRLERSIC